MINPLNRSTIQSQIGLIRRSVRVSVGEVKQFLEGPLSSLPTEMLYQAPAANEWSLMENIAHILEFLPYWADEFTKLVANPGQEFGRTIEDVGRLHAIQYYGKASLAQAKSALAISYAHLDRALCTFSDSDLQLKAHHASFGNQSLAWFIDAFILHHLTEHITQLHTCLNAIETADKKP